MTAGAALIFTFAFRLLPPAFAFTEGAGIMFANISDGA
jgi:hypothetical protein